MQKLFKITVLLVVIVSLVISGCSSSKKGQCGCPSKTGMVGY
jgi:outer membrane murein-binding lipoprotein Lpp